MQCLESFAKFVERGRAMNEESSSQYCKQMVNRFSRLYLVFDISHFCILSSLTTSLSDVLTAVLVYSHGS